MANKHVRKVSKEELAQAGAGFSAAQVAAKAIAPIPKKSTSKSYVEKLKVEDIVNFFRKYGFIRYNKFKDEAGTHFCEVNCENFDTIFNDYDIVVKCHPEYKHVLSDFDFAAFAKYCDAVDMTPEQAIADMITADLFTRRFPSYTEARKSYKQNVASTAFAALPKKMQSLVGTTHEQANAQINSMAARGKYGTFDAEFYLKTIYGSND